MNKKLSLFDVGTRDVIHLTMDFFFMVFFHYKYHFSILHFHINTTKKIKPVLQNKSENVLTGCTLHDEKDEKWLILRQYYKSLNSSGIPSNSPLSSRNN